MGLRALRPPIDLPDVRIHMYWNARNTREPGNRWLRDALVSTTERVRPASRSLGTANSSAGSG